MRTAAYIHALNRQAEAVTALRTQNYFSEEVKKIGAYAWHIVTRQ